MTLAIPGIVERNINFPSYRLLYSLAIPVNHHHFPARKIYTHDDTKWKFCVGAIYIFLLIISIIPDSVHLSGTIYFDYNYMSVCLSILF